MKAKKRGGKVNLAQFSSDTDMMQYFLITSESGLNFIV